MSIRNIMYTCVILGSLGMPTLAMADFDVDVTTAPPAPKIEAVPEARPGYVWAPGYWKWEGTDHVWVTGHWVEAQLHSHWVPDKWTEDPNRPGHWHFRSGYWEAD
jgi:hypothetical protein